MKCKGKLDLDKLIMGDNSLYTPENLFLKINRYLDLRKNSIMQGYNKSDSYRYIFNRNINEMSMHSACSKNAMRKNIFYIHTFREYYKK